MICSQGCNIYIYIYSYLIFLFIPYRYIRYMYLTQQSIYLFISFNICIGFPIVCSVILVFKINNVRFFQDLEISSSIAL